MNKPQEDKKKFIKHRLMTLDVELLVLAEVMKKILEEGEHLRTELAWMEKKNGRPLVN